LSAVDQLDRIEQRLVRLDARGKHSAGQMGLFGGGPGNGQPCGRGHIAADLTCHKGGSGAAAGEPAGQVNYDPAASKARAKGGLQFSRGRDGRHTAYRYTFRDRDAAEHWLAEEAARSETDIEVGTANRRGKEWQQAYSNAYREQRETLRSFDDRGLFEFTENMAMVGKATGRGTVVDVRIGGNPFSRPVRTSAQPADPEPPAVAPAPRQPAAAPQLDIWSATSSQKQAQLARQQQQAAAAAGDVRGLEAWKKEERTVERKRVEGALSASRQSQQSLFGVTEYDETMPLFRRDSDPTAALLNAVMAEQLEGAQVLDWQRPRPGIHAGRLAADGLVYRFRTDGQGVAYRPAWDGLSEAEWEARSDGFLQARDPSARVDFKKVRFEQRSSKRNCSVGYSCGRSCIAMAKECQVTPSSAIGKQRLRALQALAKEGGPEFERKAAEVAAGRHAKAVQLKEERNVGQLKKLLADPRVAEMVRTGKVPEAAPKQSRVRDVSPDEIEVDAKRFQYKLNASATGEVGSLSGVKKWDPNLAGVISVWEDPEDGKTYVINGHNRLALARRLGAEEITVRYLDAPDAKHARAIGAMQNIAEGQGTEIDAAKFFRDTGIRDLQGVQDAGLPLNSGKAAKGLALQALPDGLFQTVVQGELSIGRGAIIGGSGLAPEKQEEVFRMLKRNKGMTDAGLREYVEAAFFSEQQSQGELDVLGQMRITDNLPERSMLAAGLASKLSREKRLFALVSKQKAATQLESKAGNQINVEESAAVSQEAAQVLGVFNKLKNSAGPVSSALNAAANRVKKGESKKKVQAELEQAVMRGVEEELRRLGLNSAQRNPNEELGASLFDSAAARIDAIEARLARLDARRVKQAPGQGALDLGGGPGKGQPCGESHISAGYTCWKGSVLPATLEKSLKRSVPPGAMQQMLAAGDPDFKRGRERHTPRGEPSGFDHWLNYEGEITMGPADQKKLVGELEAAGWKVHTYGPSVPQRAGDTYASHERKLPGDRGLVHDQVVIKGDKVRLLRAHQFQSATMPYLAKDVEKVGELQPVEGKGGSEFYRVKGSDRFVVRHRSGTRSHPDHARELEGKEAVQETWNVAQRDKVFQYQFGQSTVREVTRGMKPKQSLKLDSLEARLEALETWGHG